MDYQRDGQSAARRRPATAGYAPGPGWRALTRAVWEHEDGYRAHTAGYTRTRDGRWVAANEWPGARLFYRFLRADGGNRRRAVLGWARHLNGSGA